MPSIRPDQLPQLMQTMRTASISLSTRSMFMWQLLIITRPAEAAEARWDEIDFDASEWKIPAARMNMNRDHTVPLPDGALAILEMMKLLVGKTLLHGDVLMWLMNTLLISGCTNQRGAGHINSHPIDFKSWVKNCPIEK